MTLAVRAYQPLSLGLRPRPTPRPPALYGSAYKPEIYASAYHPRGSLGARNIFLTTPEAQASGNGLPKINNATMPNTVYVPWQASFPPFLSVKATLFGCLKKTQGGRGCQPAFGALGWWLHFGVANFGSKPYILVATLKMFENKRIEER